jgi:flagellar basal body-associated protein FliL
METLLIILIVLIAIAIILMAINFFRTRKPEKVQNDDTGFKLILDQYEHLPVN